MSIVDKHNKIVSEDYFYLEDIFEKPKCSGDDLCQDCPDGYLYVDADNGEGLQCYNHRHLNALVHYKNTQIKNYSLHGPNNFPSDIDILDIGHQIWYVDSNNGLSLKTLCLKHSETEDYLSIIGGIKNGCTNDRGGLYGDGNLGDWPVIMNDKEFSDFINLLGNYDINNNSIGVKNLDLSGNPKLSIPSGEVEHQITINTLEEINVSNTGTQVHPKNTFNLEKARQYSNNKKGLKVYIDWNDNLKSVNFNNSTKWFHFDNEDKLTKFYTGNIKIVLAKELEKDFEFNHKDVDVKRYLQTNINYKKENVLNITEISYDEIINPVTTSESRDGIGCNGGSPTSYIDDCGVCVDPEPVNSEIIECKATIRILLSTLPHTEASGYQQYETPTYLEKEFLFSHQSNDWMNGEDVPPNAPYFSSVNLNTKALCSPQNIMRAITLDKGFAHPINDAYHPNEFQSIFCNKSGQTSTNIGDELLWDLMPDNHTCFDGEHDVTNWWNVDVNQYQFDVVKGDGQQGRNNILASQIPDDSVPWTSAIRHVLLADEFKIKYQDAYGQPVDYINHGCEDGGEKGNPNSINIPKSEWGFRRNIYSVDRFPWDYGNENYSWDQQWINAYTGEVESYHSLPSLKSPESLTNQNVEGSMSDINTETTRNYLFHGLWGDTRTDDPENLTTWNSHNFRNYYCNDLDNECGEPNVGYWDWLTSVSRFAADNTGPFRYGHPNEHDYSIQSAIQSRMCVRFNNYMYAGNIGGPAPKTMGVNPDQSHVYYGNQLQGDMDYWEARNYEMHGCGTWNDGQNDERPPGVFQGAGTAGYEMGMFNGNYEPIGYHYNDGYVPNRELARDIFGWDYLQSVEMYRGKSPSGPASFYLPDKILRVGFAQAQLREITIKPLLAIDASPVNSVPNLNDEGCGCFQGPPVLFYYDLDGDGRGDETQNQNFCYTEYDDTDITTHCGRNPQTNELQPCTGFNSEIEHSPSIVLPSDGEYSTDVVPVPPESNQYGFNDVLHLFWDDNLYEALSGVAGYENSQLAYYGPDVSGNYDNDVGAISQDICNQELWWILGQKKRSPLWVPEHKQAQIEIFKSICNHYGMDYHWDDTTFEMRSIEDEDIGDADPAGQLDFRPGICRWNFGSGNLDPLNPWPEIYDKYEIYGHISYDYPNVGTNYYNIQNGGVYACNDWPIGLQNTQNGYVSRWGTHIGNCPCTQEELNENFQKCNQLPKLYYTRFLVCNASNDLTGYSPDTNSQMIPGGYTTVYGDDDVECNTTEPYNQYTNPFGLDICGNCPPGTNCVRSDEHNPGTGGPPCFHVQNNGQFFGWYSQYRLANDYYITDEYNGCRAPNTLDYYINMSEANSTCDGLDIQELGNNFLEGCNQTYIPWQQSEDVFGNSPVVMSGTNYIYSNSNPSGWQVYREFSNYRQDNIETVLHINNGEYHWPITAIIGRGLPPAQSSTQTDAYANNQRPLWTWGYYFYDNSSGEVYDYTTSGEVTEGHDVGLFPQYIQPYEDYLKKQNLLYSTSAENVLDVFGSLQEWGLFKIDETEVDNYAEGFIEEFTNDHYYKYNNQNIKNELGYVSGGISKETAEQLKITEVGNASQSLISKYFWPSAEGGYQNLINIGNKITQEEDPQLLGCTYEPGNNNTNLSGDNLTNQNYFWTEGDEELLQVYRYQGPQNFDCGCSTNNQFKEDPAGNCIPNKQLSIEAGDYFLPYAFKYKPDSLMTDLPTCPSYVVCPSYEWFEHLDNGIYEWLYRYGMNQKCDYYYGLSYVSRELNWPAQSEDDIPDGWYTTNGDINLLDDNLPYVLFENDYESIPFVTHLYGPLYYTTFGIYPDQAFYDYCNGEWLDRCNFGCTFETSPGYVNYDELSDAFQIGPDSFKNVCQGGLFSGQLCNSDEDCTLYLNEPGNVYCFDAMASNITLEKHEPENSSSYPYPFYGLTLPEDGSGQYKIDNYIWRKINYGGMFLPYIQQNNTSTIESLSDLGSGYSTHLLEFYVIPYITNVNTDNILSLDWSQVPIYVDGIFEQEEDSQNLFDFNTPGTTDESEYSGVFGRKWFRKSDNSELTIQEHRNLRFNNSNNISRAYGNDGWYGSFNQFNLQNTSWVKIVNDNNFDISYDHPALLNIVYIQSQSDIFLNTYSNVTPDITKHFSLKINKRSYEQEPYIDLQNGQMSSEAVRNLITNSGTYCKHTADLSQPDSNQSLYQWFGCDCKIGKCGYCRNNVQNQILNYFYHPYENSTDTDDEVSFGYGFGKIDKMPMTREFCETFGAPGNPYGNNWTWISEPFDDNGNVHSPDTCINSGYSWSINRVDPYSLTCGGMGKTYWYPDYDKDLYGCDVVRYVCSESNYETECNPDSGNNDCMVDGQLGERTQGECILDDRFGNIQLGNNPAVYQQPYPFVDDIDEEEIPPEPYICSQNKVGRICSCLDICKTNVLWSKGDLDETEGLQSIGVIYADFAYTSGRYSGVPVIHRECLEYCENEITNSNPDDIDYFKGYEELNPQNPSISGCLCPFPFDDCNNCCNDVDCNGIDYCTYNSLQVIDLSQYGFSGEQEGPPTEDQFDTQELYIGYFKLWLNLHPGKCTGGWGDIGASTCVGDFGVDVDCFGVPQSKWGEVYGTSNSGAYWDCRNYQIDNILLSYDTKIASNFCHLPIHIEPPNMVDYQLRDCYLDFDNDGWGNPNIVQEQCVQIIDDGYNCNPWNEPLNSNPLNGIHTTDNADDVDDLTFCLSNRFDCGFTNPTGYFSIDDYENIDNITYNFENCIHEINGIDYVIAQSMCGDDGQCVNIQNEEQCTNYKEKYFLGYSLFSGEKCYVEPRVLNDCELCVGGNSEIPKFTEYYTWDGTGDYNQTNFVTQLLDYGKDCNSICDGPAEVDDCKMCRSGGGPCIDSPHFNKNLIIENYEVGFVNGRSRTSGENGGRKLFNLDKVNTKSERKINQNISSYHSIGETKKPNFIDANTQFIYNESDGVITPFSSRNCGESGTFEEYLSDVLPNGIDSLYDITMPTIAWDPNYNQNIVGCDDYDGEGSCNGQFSFSDYQGDNSRFIVIDYGAQWCDGCTNSILDFSNYQEEIYDWFNSFPNIPGPANENIIFVSVLSDYHPFTSAQQWANLYNWIPVETGGTDNSSQGSSIPVIYNQNFHTAEEPNLGNVLQITSIPTYYVVNPDGCFTNYNNISIDNLKSIIADYYDLNVPFITIDDVTGDFVTISFSNLQTNGINNINFKLSGVTSINNITILNNIDYNVTHDDTNNVVLNSSSSFQDDVQLTIEIDGYAQSFIQIIDAEANSIDMAMGPPVQVETDDDSEPEAYITVSNPTETTFQIMIQNSHPVDMLDINFTAENITLDGIYLNDNQGYLGSYWNIIDWSEDDYNPSAYHLRLEADESPDHAIPPNTTTYQIFSVEYTSIIPDSCDEGYNGEYTECGCGVEEALSRPNVYCTDEDIDFLGIQNPYWAGDDTKQYTYDSLSPYHNLLNGVASWQEVCGNSPEFQQDRIYIAPCPPGQDCLGFYYGIDEITYNYPKPTYKGNWTWVCSKELICLETGSPVNYSIGNILVEGNVDCFGEDAEIGTPCGNGGGSCVENNKYLQSFGPTWVELDLEKPDGTKLYNSQYTELGYRTTDREICQYECCGGTVDSDGFNTGYGCCKDESYFEKNINYDVSSCPGFNQFECRNSSGILVEDSSCEVDCQNCCNNLGDDENPIWDGSCFRTGMFYNYENSTIFPPNCDSSAGNVTEVHFEDLTTIENYMYKCLDRFDVGTDDYIYCNQVCHEYLPVTGQENILFNISAVNVTEILDNGEFKKYSNYQPADGEVLVCIDSEDGEYFDESFSRNCNQDYPVILKFKLIQISGTTGEISVSIKNNINVSGVQFNLTFGNVSIKNEDGSAPTLTVNNGSELFNQLGWQTYVKSPENYDNLVTFVSYHDEFVQNLYEEYNQYQFIQPSNEFKLTTSSISFNYGSLFKIPDYRVPKPRYNINNVPVDENYFNHFDCCQKYEWVPELNDFGKSIEYCTQFKDEYYNDGCCYFNVANWVLGKSAGEAGDYDISCVDFVTRCGADARDAYVQCGGAGTHYCTDTLRGCPTEVGVNWQIKCSLANVNNPSLDNCEESHLNPIPWPLVYVAALENDDCYGADGNITGVTCSNQMDMATEGFEDIFKSFYFGLDNHYCEQTLGQPGATCGKPFDSILGGWGDSTFSMTGGLLAGQNISVNNFEGMHTSGGYNSNLYQIYSGNDGDYDSTHPGYVNFPYDAQAGGIPDNQGSLLACLSYTQQNGGKCIPFVRVKNFDLFNDANLTCGDWNYGGPCVCQRQVEYTDNITGLPSYEFITGEPYGLLYDSCLNCDSDDFTGCWSHFGGGDCNDTPGQSIPFNSNFNGRQTQPKEPSRWDKHPLFPIVSEYSPSLCPDYEGDNCGIPNGITEQLDGIFNYDYFNTNDCTDCAGVANWYIDLDYDVKLTNSDCAGVCFETFDDLIPFIEYSFEDDCGQCINPFESRIIPNCILNSDGEAVDDDECKIFVEWFNSNYEPQYDYTVPTLYEFGNVVGELVTRTTSQLLIHTFDCNYTCGGSSQLDDCGCCTGGGTSGNFCYNINSGTNISCGQSPCPSNWAKNDCGTCFGDGYNTGQNNIVSCEKSVYDSPYLNEFYNYSEDNSTVDYCEVSYCYKDGEPNNTHYSSNENICETNGGTWMEDGDLGINLFTEYGKSCRPLNNTGDNSLPHGDEDMGVCPAKGPDVRACQCYEQYCQPQPSSNQCEDDNIIYNCPSKFCYYLPGFTNWPAEVFGDGYESTILDDDGFDDCPNVCGGSNVWLPSATEECGDCSQTANGKAVVDECGNCIQTIFSENPAYIDPTTGEPSATYADQCMPIEDCPSEYLPKYMSVDYNPCLDPSHIVCNETYNAQCMGCSDDGNYTQLEWENLGSDNRLYNIWPENSENHPIENKPPNNWNYAFNNPIYEQEQASCNYSYHLEFYNKIIDDGSCIRPTKYYSDCDLDNTYCQDEVTRYCNPIFIQMGIDNSDLITNYWDGAEDDT